MLIVNNSDIRLMIIDRLTPKDILQNYEKFKYFFI